MIICSIYASGLTAGHCYQVADKTDCGVYIYDDNGIYRFLSRDNFIQY